MKKLSIFLTVFIALICLFRMDYAGASEELVIVGTGSGIPLLKAVGQAFTTHHPELTIIVPPSIGSGGGIRAVGSGEYALGRVARDIQENEKKYGLKLASVAKMPIVFYVNTSIPIREITYAQACRIYSGMIRKWEDLSSGQGTIRIIRREEGDSSLLVLLKTLPGFKDITMTPRSKTAYTDQETVHACKKEMNAIAYGSLADIKHEIGIRALTLEGIYPTNPKYPHMGSLSLIYKQKNYNGNVKKFIEFIPSDAAKEAILRAGGLPVK